MGVFIKIPIILENREQVALGIKPEEAPATAYIDADQIESIQSSHDLSLGDVNDGINTEASLIQMRSGDSFLIRMHLDELVDFLSPYLKLQ